ncbi:sigma-54-dependent Fis family transcriptional regulator [Candidatus Woesearchaeota archaeon]|nr:sigma-54-dependent Fis family transcriptional regulator [Candidatus Woesearchaeota archaeon]
MNKIEHYDDPKYTIDHTGDIMLGRSHPMLALYEYINQITSFPDTVLIRGQSGTGKELVAKALHYNRDEKSNQRPFLTVDCTCIPSELLESILFGHVKGAFTGASQPKKGFVAAAEKGTLFLDEIGDLDMRLQMKLLRLLQEKEYTPVGSHVSKEADVRILAATNKPLEEAIRSGTFREDLYHRLNVFPVDVPPLSKRGDDTILLAEHYLHTYNKLHNASLTGFSEQAVERLNGLELKGNVRELESLIKRIYAIKTEGMVEYNDLLLNGEDIQKRILDRVYKTTPSVVTVISEISTTDLSSVDIDPLDRRSAHGIVTPPSPHATGYLEDTCNRR